MMMNIVTTIRTMTIFITSLNMMTFVMMMLMMMPDDDDDDAANDDHDDDYHYDDVNTDATLLFIRRPAPQTRVWACASASSSVLPKN